MPFRHKCLVYGILGHLPYCHSSDCGSIPDPANGMISAKSGTTVGKTVQFSCNLGYDLIGVETIICEDDGRWSDSAPLCVLTGLSYMPLQFIMTIIYKSIHCENLIIETDSPE